jgi:hypothetical protein
VLEKKIKKIEWEESSSTNIEKHYGRVNGIMFFEIYKFKEDPFVMTIKIPGTKERIKTGYTLKHLKYDADRIFDSFVEGLIYLVEPGIDIYAFLDIDGVVATQRAIDDRWEEYSGNPPFNGDWNKELKDNGVNFPGFSGKYWPFDQEAIKRIHFFQRYFAQRGHKIKWVISSSWRLGQSVKELNKLFRLKGLYLSKIVDKTGHKGKRGEQILKWMKDNKVKKQPFIVLDDECKHDIVQYIDEKHLIDTSFSTGFDYLKMKEAIHKVENQLK